MSETELAEPHIGGDTYAKTLSLLRRLLIGNGYKLEQVLLHQIESADYKIPGKLALELEVKQTMHRLAGPARGGEARVFRDRLEQERYLASLREQMGTDSWVDEIKSQISTLPLSGWGLEQGRWDLPQLGQRVALQLVCDLCLGVGNENCLTCAGRREMDCTTCQGNGQLSCHFCRGNGYEPSDSAKPCHVCGGRRLMSCPTCHGRRFVMCMTCRGMGITQCRDCQGLKFKTEETVVTVHAKGGFMLGDVGKAPAPVSQLVDELGADGLADGHALIVPDARGSTAMIGYTAVIPYAKMRMSLAGKDENIHVVGMKPVLIEFPKVLDDVLNPVIKQISTVSLMSLTRKYRIIRELCEALGRGVKPAHFFTERYPYGLSVECAFALVDALRLVFKNISLIPRVITGSLGLLAAAGFYLWWLSRPRPAALLELAPMYVWDIALLVTLPALLWTGIALTGKQALQRLLPTPIALRAASGRVGLGFTLALVALIIGLLLWSVTQPPWLKAWLP